MNPGVSINLCCYNSEKYLEETLQSIFAQTFKDWELVIINDGSTDATEAIIQKHIAEGWPIVYHAQPNAGLARARNQALRLSRGKYIALIDHDDLFLPDNLERQVRCLEQEQAAISYGGYIVINTKGEEKRRIIPRHQSGFLLGELLRRYEIGMSAVMVDGGALRDLKLEFDPNLSYAEEYCLFLLMATERRVAVSHSLISKLRFHASSLTNTLMEKWAWEHEYTLEQIKKRHPGIQVKYAAAFREAYARCNYYRARWLVKQGRRNEAIRELRQVALAGPKYLVFFLTLLVSTELWDWLHSRLSSNRSLG
jgi:glycosyltransferase involved in cell wall biosynthesis